VIRDIETLAKLIARTQIISFGHYILSNGLHTPYYIDFTLLSNKPGYLDTLTSQVYEYLQEKGIIRSIDKIVGILDKGVIVAIPLSLRIKYPFALFSLKNKDLSVGTIDVNDKILLVDDMLSTGQTMCKVIDIIKNKYKNEVKKVFVVLDREEGGANRLKKRGISVYRLIRISELAEVLLTYGVISDEEYEIISNHLKEARKTI
jgi:orotate phosphoribosyltransferase